MDSIIDAHKSSYIPEKDWQACDRCGLDCPATRLTFHYDGHSPDAILICEWCLSRLSASSNVCREISSSQI